MPDSGGILTLDVSSKFCGWAYGSAKGEPVFGGWVMPGGAIPGALLSALGGAIEGAIAVHQPRMVVFCVPLQKGHGNSQVLIYLAGKIEEVCWDMNVEVRSEIESHARKMVMGKGGFSVRDQQGKVIKGSGTERAKIAVLEWVNQRGWKTGSHDVGDALILWEWARRVATGRLQWGSAG